MGDRTESEVERMRDIFESRTQCLSAHQSYHSIIASLTHIKRYERLQKVYEKRLGSLERALEQCVHVTKTDSVVKQMKLDDASSKYASERVIEMFRNALDGMSDTYAHLAQYIITIVRIADITIQTTRTSCSNTPPERARDRYEC